MQEYKRITSCDDDKREVKGIYCKHYGKCHFCFNNPYCENGSMCCVILFERLKDLEDKIENGELIWKK